MKYIYIALLLLFIQNSFAQTKIWNNWYFGEKAGLNFNTEPPTVLTDGQMNAYTGCASISDTSGNLLFYSNGIEIWDKNHNIMPNGSNLTSNSNSVQAALIIPYPEHPKLFYLFTLNSNNKELSYSIVDMNLNNGNGDIDINTKNILLLNGAYHKQTAIYKPDGSGFWLVVYTQDGKLHSFSITSTGLNTTAIISSMNAPLTATQSDMNFSHKRTKLAITTSKPATFIGDTTKALLQIYDFNIYDGTFTLYKQHLYESIKDNNHYSQGYYSVEFSPDDSKLYANYYYFSYSAIWQFNLDATILSVDTIFNEFGQNFGEIRVAPNNKIYISRVSESSIACIENPNNDATNCNFILNAIDLQTGVCVGGLPNIIVFPKTDIIYNNTCLSDPTSFTINNTNNIQSVLWQLGDSQTSTALNPVHTYSNPGNYTVKLIATYNDNSSDTLTKDIEIYDKPLKPTIEHK